MDRWKLLKTALHGRRDERSQSSIHRHDGFKVLSKKFILWTWHTNYLVNSTSTWEHFYQFCEAFMTSADTTEIVVNLTHIEGQTHKCVDIVNTGIRLGLVRTHQIHTSLKKKWRRQFGEIAIYYKWMLPLPLASEAQVAAESSEEIPDGDPACVAVYTREKARDAGIGVNELLSHKLHGIDNTGNVKVWEAESILLYILLTNPYYEDDFADKRVLELGGGSTALCSLGLAAAPQHRCRDITCTDGHPDCVLNQDSCFRPDVVLRARQLRWSRGDAHHDLWRVLTDTSEDSEGGNTIAETASSCSSGICIDRLSNSSSKKFDRIIASDCMFFEKFHDDLIWTLAHALAEDGVVYMLQPRRGRTMQAFLDKAEVYFHLTVSDDYDAKIAELHRTFLLTEDAAGHEEGAAASTQHRYDPDIHFPLLVTLKRRMEVSL